MTLPNDYAELEALIATLDPTAQIVVKLSGIVAGGTLTLKASGSKGGEKLGAFKPISITIASKVAAKKPDAGAKPG